MNTMEQFYDRWWDDRGIRKAELAFWMRSDAYIPEQMAFRNISVNSKGKIIKDIK